MENTVLEKVELEAKTSEERFGLVIDISKSYKKKDERIVEGYAALAGEDRTYMYFREESRL